MMNTRLEELENRTTTLNGNTGRDAWRTAAMDLALRTEAMDGNSEDALLREIRRARPAGATLSLWPDRLQLMAFLRTRTAGFRSLLTGEDLHVERTQSCPYLGWYAVEWEGDTIEVALAPTYRVNGWTAVIAESEATLRRFDAALEEFTIRPAGRCLRYSERWESAPDLDAEVGKVTWGDLVLRPELMSGVREAVEGFVAHKDTMLDLGFAWKRGLLLVGPPGTGKTMICKAAASALPDLPFLSVRDFEAEDYGGADDAIRTIFERARKLAPCILSFEDIDGLVTDSNRSIFLNEMDGMQTNNGLLIIASSNHPEKVDEALLKRPSRFDRVFHIGLPGAAERAEFCRRMLARWRADGRLSADVDAEGLSAKAAARTAGFTPAYLKEAFVSAALQRAHAGARTLDAAFADALLAQAEDLRVHLRRLRDPESLASLEDSGVSAIGFRKV